MVSYGEFGNHMRKVFGNLHTLHIHHNLHSDAQNVQIPHNIHNMRQHQRLPPLQLRLQVQVWRLHKQWQIQGTRRSNNAENREKINYLGVSHNICQHHRQHRHQRQHQRKHQRLPTQRLLNRWTVH